MLKRLLIYIGLVIFVSCSHAQDVKVGAERMEMYLYLLKDKKVSMVVNQTSQVKGEHLVDALIEQGININTIFAPEHGFRGKADAGEHIKSSTDSKTGLPIVSLYGKNKKPSKEQLAGTDIIIFDIQDVGVRFYTYISTMHYIMEACAENDIPLIILDRPNPNGHYIDGPVLEKEFQSFVGMHPIPVVHGLTVGELAKMINGEGWLNNNLQCNLTVIPVRGWKHSDSYKLPVKPSPNLPNEAAINLYPSLCLLEPTNISIGRGTHSPFQIIGSPLSNIKDYSFTPISIEGMSKHPKHQDQECYGQDLSQTPRLSHLNLQYLIQFYQDYPEKESFFTNPRFFNLLAGTPSLKAQIISGQSAFEIRQSWQAKLEAYKSIRNNYLIYP